MCGQAEVKRTVCFGSLLPFMCSPCKECENVSPSWSGKLNFWKDTSSPAAEAAHCLQSLCLVIVINSPSLEV